MFDIMIEERRGKSYLQHNTNHFLVMLSASASQKRCRVNLLTSTIIGERRIVARAAKRAC
jgi:hypothetical protein